MRSYRSFIGSIFSLALSAMSYLAHVAVFFLQQCLSVLQPTVEFCVDVAVAIGHNLKKTNYQFSMGSGSNESLACHGFVSLRRSLDAAA